MRVQQSVRSSSSKLATRASTTWQTGGGGTGVAAASPNTAMWIFGSAGALATIVTIGTWARGARPYKEMFETWPFRASLPPRNEDHWKIEYERFRQDPAHEAFRNLNRDQFKTAYMKEYYHRLTGSLAGLSYAVPIGWLVYRGVPNHIYGRLALIVGIGAMQTIGGFFSIKKDPQNGPYRMVAHLGASFVALALLVGAGLDALHGPATPEALAKMIRGPRDPRVLRALPPLQMAVAGGVLLALGTALNGSVMAGLDAGKVFNHFPWMTDKEWVPKGVLDIEPKWRNWFENPTFAHMDHRLWAGVSLVAVVGVCSFARFGQGGKIWAALPLDAQRALTALFLAGGSQVAGGAVNALTKAPVEMSVIHNANAMAVIASSVWALHALRVARGAALAARAAK